LVLFRLNQSPLNQVIILGINHSFVLSNLNFGLVNLADECLALVSKFAQTQLKLIFLVDLLRNLVLSVGHFILRQFVLLLEINNHFILPPNGLFVVVNILFIEFDFIVLLSCQVI
jgi:hypothetical protein